MVSFRWHVIMFYFRCLRYYQYFHHFLVPLFKKKNEPKVFCIGYVKTGLTSLAKALSILGYRSVQFLRTASEPKEGWVEFIINRNYDAFTDYPLWMKDVYSRLDKVIPNSKFILSIRDNILSTCDKHLIKYLLFLLSMYCGWIPTRLFFIFLSLLILFDFSD